MSNTVDWDSAPEWATHHGNGVAGLKCWFDDVQYQYVNSGEKYDFGLRGTVAKSIMKEISERPTPQEKPMKYEYGAEYPTNGVKPDLPYDVVIRVKWKDAASTEGALKGTNVGWIATDSFSVIDERFKPSELVEPTQSTNIYDRTITGKYGTGKCTIDVYRVLAAYDVADSEVAHAVKKLLAPGQRGVKEERQDIEEAIQSLQAWIARMDDEGVK